MKTRVVNRRKESYDVYIGRPSKWGNPFTHHAVDATLAKFHVNTAYDAVEYYEKWILKQPDLLHDLHELKGKILGCWCKPGPCHGDILATLADGTYEPPDEFGFISPYHGIY